MNSVDRPEMESGPCDILLQSASMEVYHCAAEAADFQHPQGNSGCRVRCSGLQGNWWDRSLDS